MKRIEISKEELYKLYIVENKTLDEIAVFFGCGKTKIFKHCKKFNIKKDKKLTAEHKKNVCLKKYGVENPSQSNKIKEKKEQTCLKNFGVKNPSQSNKIKEKKENTFLEKYGVRHNSQIEDVKQEKRNTFLKKYGVENPGQSEEFKEKIKKTCLEKYGFETPKKSPIVQEKYTKTCLKRYGVPYSCQLPQCRFKGNNSKPNLSFESLLQQNDIEFEREFPIGKYRYDFKIGNILIEIDPTATHNSTWGTFGREPTDKNYHATKSDLAKRNGFHCVHIWDWDDEDKIIKNFLIEKERVYARKCEVRIVEKKEEKEFLETYHFQGYAPSKVALGLYSDDKLVEIMTFGKPRYNKKYEWELIRLCSSKNVVGGSKRLLKHFIDEYKPSSIISYCDLAKFSGKVYEDLGFTIREKKCKPTKHWYNPKTGYHITNNLLLQRGFDQLFGTSFGKGTNNEELMKQAGFLEIFDVGQASFVKVV